MINSRTKGKVFERLIANKLKTWPGLEDARRGLTQSGGAIEPDVTAHRWPFWSELKAMKRVDVKAAIVQAYRDMQADAVRSHAHKPGVFAVVDALKPVIVIGRDTGGDIFFAVPWTLQARLRFCAAMGCVPGVQRDDSSGSTVQRSVLLSRDGSVCNLTKGATWRNFREQLADVGESELLIVNDEVAVGWIETLEVLWNRNS